jgi:excinuclease ABC subunit C
MIDKEPINQKLKNLPEDPGCYIFKDSSGNIIYIGKAKILKRRVASYFSKKHQDDKTNALVRNINDVDFFVTGNEIEALVLENNLIKKHKPKYNIDLKDSIRYSYILVTDEKFPKLLVARDKAKPGRYYGPFVSGEAREYILKILRDTFQIRTCNKLPKKACLRYHIGLCSAPCMATQPESEYLDSIKNAESFLKGDVENLKLKLEQDMKSYSSKMMFEQARSTRDKIYAIDHLAEKQSIERDKRFDEDIINYIISDGKVYLIVFNVIKGMLATKREFMFDLTENFLDQFVKQYYSDNDIPKEIMLPIELNDNQILEYLSKIRGNKVSMLVPQKGEKKELLDLVRRNIEVSFFAESEMINGLRNVLNLQNNPNVIECFDISNTQGSNSVASMVQFRNAKPDKSNYRRFKIKTVTGSDDFSSINEVVKRRYSRLKIENQQYPDLVLIDGGIGQLNAAIDALTDVGVKIPIISLAKKFEEIYVPGRLNPIRLQADSKARKLLIQIRDEAHRFALKYHRLLRSKDMIGKA